MLRKNPNKDRLHKDQPQRPTRRGINSAQKTPKLLQSTKRGTSGRCARPNRTEPQGATTRILCWARHWRRGRKQGAAASKQKDRLRGPKSEAGLDEQRR